jgi:hypothetical protein
VKLKIEKLPGGRLRVEVAAGDGRKAPLVFEPDPMRLSVLIQLMTAAAKAETFDFSPEL